MFHRGRGTLKDRGGNSLKHGGFTADNRSSSLNLFYLCYREREAEREKGLKRDQLAISEFVWLVLSVLLMLLFKFTILFITLFSLPK